MNALSRLSSIDWRKINWQDELKNNIDTVDKLYEYIDLTDSEKKILGEVVANNPMNIPRYYLSLIDPENESDPIRKMSFPGREELIVTGQMGETTDDPYGDDKYDKGNGILHKYSYSALIVATDYCSMYCRHCFRKRMVGLPNEQTVDNFQQATKYVKDHKEITNVVISGGDPFLINTPGLIKMLDGLKTIDHVNFVRIGTRTPVVYPMRFFDDELLDYMAEFNKIKALYVPTHFNHINEITDIAEEAVLKIRQTGTTVNNQTVFLKGVNDSVENIENLMNGLIRIGVNPYYLYQCMPVTRVRHHFQVPLKTGVDIVDRAKNRLDGYAKRFKFIIGHEIGKIEICGRINDKLILKRLHNGDSRMIVMKLDDKAGWLDDMEEIVLEDNFDYKIELTENHIERECGKILFTQKKIGKIDGKVSTELLSCK
ncbi:MAG TPA: KamA family radical SAM protein [Victivallales bacterium]|nr:KamA family radical SAM protein [Victivallales bacterium]